MQQNLARRHTAENNRSLVVVFDDEPSTLEETIEKLASEGALIVRARNLPEFSFLLRRYSSNGQQGAEHGNDHDDDYWGEGLPPTGTIDLIVLDIFLPDVSNLSALGLPNIRVRSDEAGYYIWRRYLHAPGSPFENTPVLLTSEYAFIDDHRPDIEKVQRDNSLPVWIYKKTQQDKNTLGRILQKIATWRTWDLGNSLVRQKILQHAIEKLRLSYDDAACVLGLGREQAGAVRMYCENGDVIAVENPGEVNKQIDLLFELMEVLGALFADNWEQIHLWVNAENHELGGESPLKIMRGGRPEHLRSVLSLLAGP